MKLKNMIPFFLMLIFGGVCLSQEGLSPSKQNVSGVFSSTAMVAKHNPRTEAGTGALMPWADRLWCITYVAHMKNTGSGTGLYEIDENFNLKRHPESVVATYANRLVHAPTQQLIIGPHLIDTLGNVRTISDITGYRLAATMEHLEDPENKVYFLAMEGDFLEVDLRTMKVNYLFDLKKELDEPEGSKPHFKSGFTNHGRVVVANNSYSKKDFKGEWQAGRLAEWSGKKWTILEKKPFTEVWSARAFGSPMMANGWDRSSAILQVFINGNWKRYRLPKSSYAFDETSTTEWMRIREVETERALMDCHGLFYEISYHTYSGVPWGIRPISKHLRVIPDFCSWRGMLVLGGNQATPMKFKEQDRNPLAGQPQANLWFGKTDDLWSFGKPTGIGGPWYETDVKAGEASDPYLMYGFDQKVLHIKHEENKEMVFTIEVDFVGDGTWSTYDTIKVGSKGYAHHEFPSGFNAHWVRITPNSDGKVTAYFIYQ